MNTIFYKIDCGSMDMSKIKEAANILKKGGLVAFPTETVYGLGANAFDVDAIKKIYEAKGRPSDNPLILHICDISYMKNIVSYIPYKALVLMDNFWPGPLTLILPKSSIIPYEITGGLETVAVRFPSHPIAQLLIKEANLPIAAPSANSSGKPSPTNAEHVKCDLLGKIDMILDGGISSVGLESTILDVTSDVPTLLRPGSITIDMIEEKIGLVNVDSSIFLKDDNNTRPKAPGMKYKHYSPDADVILVKGNIDDVVKKINEISNTNEINGLKVGIMATKQTINKYKFGTVLSLGDRNNISEIASNLFKTLREFDTLGVDIIYSEVFDDKYEGVAVMNRLNKSANYSYINV